MASACIGSNGGSTTLAEGDEEGVEIRFGGVKNASSSRYSTGGSPRRAGEPAGVPCWIGPDEDQGTCAGCKVSGNTGARGAGSLLREVFRGLLRTFSLLFVLRIEAGLTLVVDAYDREGPATGCPDWLVNPTEGILDGPAAEGNPNALSI